MRTGRGSRVAMAGLCLVLAAGVAGCSDPGAEANAAAAENAQHEAALKTDKLEQKAQYDAGCASAIRWQAATLATTNIGKVSLYTDYYRADLEKALGSNSLPAAPPLPALSKATIDPYLEAAYAQGVKTKFDGRAPGMIAACIQAVAEMGQGPLAGPDKIQRMVHMQALTVRLKNAGA